MSLVHAVRANPPGRLAVATQWSERSVLHLDDFAGVDDLECRRKLLAQGRELLANHFFLADQKDVDRVLPAGQDRSFDDFARGEITAHRVERDAASSRSRAFTVHRHLGTVTGNR